MRRRDAERVGSQGRHVCQRLVMAPVASARKQDQVLVCGPSEFRNWDPLKDLGGGGLARRLLPHLFSSVSLRLTSLAESSVRAEVSSSQPGSWPRCHLVIICRMGGVELKKLRAARAPLCSGCEMPRGERAGCCPERGWGRGAGLGNLGACRAAVSLPLWAGS